MDVLEDRLRRIANATCGIWIGGWLMIFGYGIYSVVELITQKL